MFINSELKRVNIYAPYVDAQGTSHLNLLDAKVREAAGVTEIQEPSAPADYSDFLYFKTEHDYPPYVVYERKPDEMLRAAAKVTANAAALAYLQSTDWYSIREVDTGVPVPPEVKQGRINARTTLNTV